MSKAQDILSKGLLAGFAGTSDFGTVTRGGFTLTSSEVPFSQKDSQYMDQWIGKKNGGGQELVKSGNELATRVYAGGTVSDGVLKTLGIQDKDIMSYLKEKLVALSGVTRLSESVGPMVDGNWQYRYQILKTYPHVPLTIGVEAIAYKGVDVFIHVFLNTPIA